MGAFLNRVRLRHYRSIAGCDVRLDPLTFLVGPNGGGKSNFLDALRFVADALDDTLDHAVRERGGIGEVRRRSSGHPTHFGIRLNFVLPDGRGAHYAFKIAAEADKGFRVQDEECVVSPSEALDDGSRFRVREGEVTTSMKMPPPSSPDRLYLVRASGDEAFRPVFDALTGMTFYNLNPEQIRDWQPPDASNLLARDGRNIASIIDQLTSTRPAAMKRIQQYLGQVVRGVEQVYRKELGNKETVEFRQRVKGASSPWRFHAASMSDGTLRALGVLVALFQARNGTASPVTLVGIEEPEIALHPAASELLFDALREASKTVQVIVTSHSTDLLDDERIDASTIRAVTADEGVTTIGPVSEAGRSALRKRLFTAGELLRMDQLVPSGDATADAEALRLFGDDV